MRTDLLPPIADVRHLVQLALQEDLTPLGDLSSSLLPAGLTSNAQLETRESGVIAGTTCVNEVLLQMDSEIAINWFVAEGESVEAGTVLAEITGPFSSILTAERTALNFLSHLSGIATNASKWVQLASGRVKVWDTRKTLPGYRSLQKAAVRAGGANNHRGNLSDWIMLKDNHLAHSSIAEAVGLAKDRWPGRTVQVEVDNEAQASEALAAGVDILMFDNFEPQRLTKAVVALKSEAASAGLRVPLLEASGGISLETLDAYADTGVDLVSSGSLTNTTHVLDIGLDVSAS